MAMPAVFYVDDSRDDLVYLKYVCRKNGGDIDLHCFSTADEAMSALETLHAEGQTLPQCLVVDLYMPFDNGLALIATLRADARFSYMRLGVCSGSDAVIDRQRALASGADFYLEKPLDLGAVMERLQ
jgi:CheY-like chemotaxis protein